MPFFIPRGQKKPENSTLRNDVLPQQSPHQPCSKTTPSRSLCPVRQETSSSVSRPCSCDSTHVRLTGNLTLYAKIQPPGKQLAVCQERLPGAGAKRGRSEGVSARSLDPTARIANDTGQQLCKNLAPRSRNSQQPLRQQRAAPAPVEQPKRKRGRPPKDSKRAPDACDNINANFSEELVRPVAVRAGSQENPLVPPRRKQTSRLRSSRVTACAWSSPPH
eukprot:765069-Hanusia_phi.AAC.4